MPRNYKTLTVASGGPTVSSTLELAPDEVVVGIQLSATFDGTALTVTGNADGSATLVPVKDVYGNAVSLTIADDTANYYYLAPEISYGLMRFALTSNAAQGGAETIKIITESGV